MLRGRREHARGRGDVGARERRIAHQQRLVGAQRERLVERAQRALRAHAERRDLAVGAGRPLLQPHGLLERVRVVGVHRLLAGAIELLGARIDPLGRGRVRHLLDAYGDLQRSWLLVAPCGRRPPARRPEDTDRRRAGSGGRSAKWHSRRVPLAARRQACATGCGIVLSMAPLSGRPGSRRWCSRSRLRPLRAADTSNIVFPVAGPVIKWHDDYGTRQRRHAAARERDRRQAGHARRGRRGRARAHALAGRRRLEPDADDLRRQQVRLPAPRPGRQPQERVPAGAARRRARQAGAAPRLERLLRQRDRQDAAARVPVPAGRRRAGRSLRAAGERPPAAGRRAARARRPGQAAPDGRADLERARHQGRDSCASAPRASSATARRSASSSR